MKSFVKKGHHEKADLTSEIADEMTGVRCLSFCNQKRVINFISDIFMPLVNIISVIFCILYRPPQWAKYWVQVLLPRRPLLRMGKVLPFPYLANTVNRTKRITQALAREERR